MTSRQFWMGALILAAVLVIAGPLGYFSMTNYQKAQETQLQIEREATERSEHRWDMADKMLQRLPFMKRDEDN